jgi:hypothetical protein
MNVEIEMCTRGMKNIKGSAQEGFILLVGQCGTMSSQLLSKHVRHRRIMNSSTSKYANLSMLSIALLLITGINMHQYYRFMLDLSTLQCTANRVLIYYKGRIMRRLQAVGDGEAVKFHNIEQ